MYAEALQCPVPPTPVFTIHARRRCEQMGVTTKAVKQAFRSRWTTDYPCPRKYGLGKRIRVCPSSDLAIVYDPRTEPPTVVTVLWNHDFVREAV